MPFFTFNPKPIPAAADTRRAATGWQRLGETLAGKAAGEAAGEAFVHALSENPGTRALLDAIFGNSPFLTRCVLAEPDFTAALVEHGPDAMRDKVLAATGEKAVGLGEADLKAHLRRCKRQVQLLTAVADIAAIWSLNQVTGCLSDFADAAVAATARFLLNDLAKNNAFTLNHPDNSEKDSGLVILALGKLGGRELNYSSDIDLIILFDPDRIKTEDPDGLQNHFVRLARRMVSILEDRTADGYVFRTDLRLRPDPGSTPPAISTFAAETYYESIGQNWERAAMIKARPIAGDVAAGKDFLACLKPFIWRKSLDFAAIEDIHSIKRQINAHRGSNTIKLKGHNVKLGRGGIREIEFYAQTQQLIWGGRDPNLRTVPTQHSLLMLSEAGHIKLADAETLIRCYQFLRRVEHRLQMLNDEQTHELPDNDEELNNIAIFLGFDNADAFGREILEVLKTVEGLYGDLFDDSPSLGAEPEGFAGNLVFTGGESDPETLKTLQGLGFDNAQAVDSTIRGWHHGRYRSTRSTRGRQLLTALMPVILKAFGATTEPDAAFMRFDSFLAKLPAGVQLFSMFQVNPQLLDLLATIMGTAPRLAEHLSQKARLLDGVLSADFFDAPPDADAMTEDLNKVLAEATCMEDTLDITRRWGKDRKFQIGVGVLRGTLDEHSSQRALSNVAEVLIRALQPRIEAEFSAVHGNITKGELTVVAFGKFGGREKTPTSDLDLIFIYDCDKGVDQSDGPKPLAVSQYYARLSQRLINALSAPTAEGSLYEVDMRLRPSGASGPIATSVAGFETYQNENAWTWEHMALCRARAVSGPDVLCQKVESVIRGQLMRQRDLGQLVVDVADMRQRIDQTHRTETPWAIKHYRGGLVDVEFIAQYLTLANAHDKPDILSPSTRQTLVNLGEAGVLDAKTSNDLVAALDLWQTVQGLVRLTTVYDQRKRREYRLSQDLERVFCQATGVENMAALEAKMKSTAAWVLETYEALIERPADAARTALEIEPPLENINDD